MFFCVLYGGQRVKRFGVREGFLGAFIKVSRLQGSVFGNVLVGRYRYVFPTSLLSSTQRMLQ